MIIQKIRELHNQILDLNQYLAIPEVLLARLYVASVFLSAGLTKIKDWDSTLDLFEYEYAVPLLPYDVAAFAGTAAELVLPVLLAVGLFTRLSAFGLFFVNLVAVISLTDIAPAALNEHLFWGALIAMIFFQGGGLLSADRKLKLS